MQDVNRVTSVRWNLGFEHVGMKYHSNERVEKAAPAIADLISRCPASDLELKHFAGEGECGGKGTRLNLLEVSFQEKESAPFADHRSLPAATSLRPKSCVWFSI